MNFEDLNFKKGQRVNCVAINRGKGTRPDVHLTVNKLYTIIDIEKTPGLYQSMTVSVENDNGVVEKYSSKRFKFDRESILSDLLD